MSIKFFIPGYDGGKPKRALFRFRSLIPLQGMRPEDGIITKISQAQKGDLVVLAKKSTPKDLFQLKSNNIKCVYDICDNRWRKYVAPNWVTRVIQPHNVMCNNADGLVTTCVDMQRLIMKHIGRNSFIINDPVEATKQEPKIALKSRRYLKIFTYGNSKHFSKVQWNLLIKKFTDSEIEFKINAMMDRSKKFIEMYPDAIESGRLTIHEFDWDKQYELMNDADVIFLPIVVNSMDNLIDIRAKSPNRIMDAIYSGKPVVSNFGINSYMPFQAFSDFGGNARSLDYSDWIQCFRTLINRPKEATMNMLKQGQKYIDLNHSPEVIGKQWIDLENRVGKV